MIDLGMPTLIENSILEDNIKLCKELGLSFIELNMNFPEYQIDKIEDVEYFIKAADEVGIYYTIHLDENLNVAEFNPIVRKAYLETVRRTIEVAKRFVELCERWIGEADIKIAIENTDGFRDYEKKAIEYILQSPYFVLTWDIGHSKGTKEMDVPFILEHEDKLKHFHIHDGKENPPKNHLALGDGEIDILERIEKVRECNARCVLETKTIEALIKSVNWIKNNF